MMDRRDDRLTLEPALIAQMREIVPDVATTVIEAITAEVPGYAGALPGPMGETISRAVLVALDGFLTLIERPRGERISPKAPAVRGAYDLGRGEARTGRTGDALLAAYRVGARVAWRELAAIAVAEGASPRTLARFAEVVFAYIDELSDSSAAGHADELRLTGRAREIHLDRLAGLLLSGESEDVLRGAAARASWPVPRTLTAVVLPSSQVRAAMSALSQRTLVGETAGDDRGPERTVLLVPDVRSRSRLVAQLAGRGAVVGPERPWNHADRSYRRALRALAHTHGSGTDETVDTDDLLVDLVLTADPDALADLRERVLAPLADLSPTARDRLAATLRSWLLLQGRRELVAADLFVHPQTVRYRMGQIRERYGDRLEDPGWTLAMLVALGTPDGRGRSSGTGDERHG